MNRSIQDSVRHYTLSGKGNVDDFGKYGNALNYRNPRAIIGRDLKLGTVVERTLK